MYESRELEKTLVDWNRLQFIDIKDIKKLYGKRLSATLFRDLVSNRYIVNHHYHSTVNYTDNIKMERWDIYFIEDGEEKYIRVSKI